MATPIRSVCNTLIELFYPSNCVGCGHGQSAGVLLCEQCRKSVTRIADPYCNVCSRPFEGLISGIFACPNCEDRPPAFDCVVSKYHAKGLLRDLIHRFKYGRQFYLRGVLAQYLVEAMQDERILAQAADCIVPVPLHPTRFRERGFNQAEALAEAVFKRGGVPRVSILRCIQRKRYTQTQTRFDRSERMLNLRNSFAMRKNSDVRGKHLVLLDDILTTGSTLHECAVVLREAGAESVRAITVARG
jgi:competence protein ComFC